MNKQDAQQKLDEAKKLISECQAILDKPDAPVNPVFVPLAGDAYSYTRQIGGFGGNTILTSMRYLTDDVKVSAVAFRTEQAAKDYAEAFQVMLELRACDGVVPRKGPLEQYHYITISSAKHRHDSLSCSAIYGASYTIGSISPAFNSRADVEFAINKVGMQRITKAFATLAWIE